MINKAMIDKMLALPDDKMLLMLKIALSGAGVDIPSNKIEANTVSKIRSLLAEMTDDDLGRLTYLAERFRSGGRNGK